MSNAKSTLLLYLKGAAMGAADVVPGVSGGTIAFISGIYEELLQSIRSINLAALGVLRRDGIKAFWQHINGTFLLVLFAGILTSVFSLAHLVSYALEAHPILVWSFFFGLIIASVIYISRHFEALRWQEAIALVLGTTIAVGIGFSPPLQLSGASLVVFLSGALAICAMILPGISGSFILVLIGMYSVIIQAVTEQDWMLLAIFALGCGCGLMLFARFLSWCLAHFHSVTMALLTGFLLGSLTIVWPWKEAMEIAIDHHGNETVLSHRLLMPGEFGELTGTDPQTLLAVCLMIFGVVLVLGLEYIGSRSRRP